MEDDNQSEEAKGQAQKAHASRSIKASWSALKKYLSSVLSLKSGIDKAATLEGIRSDVDFKGAAAWILVCSTLIASIGLGENNVAVIIGAMLISPLMGPILGIGLAAGINDFDLLKRSLTNFGLAVAISLIISTVYFLINPVVNVTPELASRRSAVLTAIAIAILGGAAGIIAGSRSQKSNVVPGVAIATALMPPLCTAGYGLASLQMDYLFGALYLFFINSVFIAVPTYLYIRYMKFPIKEFVDPIREAKIKRYIWLFIIITVVPSGIAFYQVLTESFFRKNTELFVNHIKEGLEGTPTSVAYFETIHTDSMDVLKVALVGTTVPEITIAQWKNQMTEKNLDKCKLVIFQNEDMTTVLADIQEKSFAQNRLLVQDMLYRKEQEVDTLTYQLAQFEKKDEATKSILEEAHIVFPEITRSGYAEYLELDRDGNKRLMPTLLIDWQADLTEEQRDRLQARLVHWFQVRLTQPNIQVIPYPTSKNE
ncbi:MAG: putative hydrophobic protein (TIGR00271 family) [Flavobacteriales bacterium]|jgi:uncharacterized hydrophobic protein (TIGR00271 family)